MSRDLNDNKEIAMRSSECRVFQTEAKKSLIISRNIKKVSDAGGDKEKGRVWR